MENVLKFLLTRTHYWNSQPCFISGHHSILQTIRLALRPAPLTTRLHPLPYIHMYKVVQFDLLFVVLCFRSTWVHHRFLVGFRVTRSLVLCLCFVDRSLHFFFWPLCCLFFFDIWILIVPLVSSNSSQSCYICYSWGSNLLYVFASDTFDSHEQSLSL